MEFVTLEGQPKEESMSSRGGAELGLHGGATDVNIYRPHTFISPNSSYQPT